MRWIQRLSATATLARRYVALGPCVGGERPSGEAPEIPIDRLRWQIGSGDDAVGIGALTIGNVKYQTQQQLLRRMHGATEPQVLSFTEAFEVARTHLAASA